VEGNIGLLEGTREAKGVVEEEFSVGEYVRPGIKSDCRGIDGFVSIDRGSSDPTDVKSTDKALSELSSSKVSMTCFNYFFTALVLFDWRNLSCLDKSCKSELSLASSSCLLSRSRPSDSSLNDVERA